MAHFLFQVQKCMFLPTHAEVRIFFSYMNSKIILFQMAVYFTWNHSITPRSKGIKSLIKYWTPQSLNCLTCQTQNMRDSIQVLDGSRAVSYNRVVQSNNLYPLVCTPCYILLNKFHETYKKHATTRAMLCIWDLKQFPNIRCYMI